MTTEATNPALENAAKYEAEMAANLDRAHRAGARTAILECARLLRLQGRLDSSQMLTERMDLIIATSGNIWDRSK